VNFSDRAPSKEWTALKHLPDESAEAWFKPEGEPFAVLFRIPQVRFQIDDITQQLTVEDLLRAADIANEDVASWQFGDEFHLGMDGTNPELKRLLPPPPQDTSHLTVRVGLKPPAAAAVRGDGDLQEVSPETWQALEAIWRIILGLETSIDTLRLSMDTLRLELETGFKRTLTVEEKVDALQADVVQWNKAKGRVHYALPKLREYIHRATWAQGIPERKRLEEVLENHILPRIPHRDLDQVREELGHLQKDRQVLFAQGSSVYQEGRGLLAEIQRTLSTLQRNAANIALKKRQARREKGKYF
jgi:hypothetical protein